MSQTQKTAYSAVIVKPRLNPRRTEELRGAGIPYYFRERNQDEAIRERHATQARDIGRNPWRGQRVDATGAQRPDSGTPVFGWEGAKHEAITLAAIVSDMLSGGYMLVKASITQKEGDKMSALYLRFEPQGSSIPAFTLTKEGERAINALLANSWSHIHVYRNPDGTCTINPAHIVANGDMANVSDPRALHMSADGGFRNQKIRRPATQATQA